MIPIPPQLLTGPSIFSTLLGWIILAVFAVGVYFDGDQLTSTEVIFIVVIAAGMTVATTVRYLNRDLPPANRDYDVSPKRSIESLLTDAQKSELVDKLREELESAATGEFF